VTRARRRSATDRRFALPGVADAELVAFGVGQHDPPVAVLFDRLVDDAVRAQTFEAGDFVVDRRGLDSKCIRFLPDFGSSTRCNSNFDRFPSGSTRST
jgi:hypothetical protein